MANSTVEIPGYRIEQKLGHGGMATVYLATQHNFERHVALKVMSPMLNSDPTFAARFKREARIVAQLNHASIVPVFEVGEHDNHHFLSMEYLPGGDLKRRILLGKSGLGIAVDVCVAISAALDVAHRKGFVHRDVKPENILFREDGTPVLTDFGIARAVESSRSLTMAGMLVGTPDYMSPEQVKGLELDGRSDLYSVGTVFYEILTGSVPFKADSTLSIALKQVSDPLPSLPVEYAAYQDFINRLTAKDRDDRFATGTDVIRALGMIGNGRSYSFGESIGHANNASKTSLSAELRPSEPTIARAFLSRERPSTERVSEPPPSRAKPAAVGSAAPRLQGAALRGRQLRWIAVAAGFLLVVTAAVVFKVTQRSANAEPPLFAQLPAVAQNDQADATGASNVSALESSAGSEAPASSSGAANAAQTAATMSPSAAMPTVSPAATVSAGGVDVAAAQSKADALERKRRQTEERRQRQAEQAQAIALRAAALRAEQLHAQDIKIQALLLEAKSEFAAGAIWRPAGANAAESYRNILTMQPDRPEALAGARRVAGVLAAEGEHAEAANDVYNSQLLVSLVRSLDPDNMKLAALQDRLQQMLDKPTDLSGRERSHLEKAAKYVAAAYDDLTRNPLDYRAADDATDQYDKAISAAPLAPGLPSLKERLVTAYIIAARTELDNHNAKHALKLISNAHKRGWLSPELAAVEASVNADAPAAAGVKEASTR